MSKCCMPIFGNGWNNGKTACICLYLVRFPKLGHPAFQRRKHKAFTSHTTCRDSASCGIARRRSWHCFPGPFNVMKRRRRGRKQRMSLQKREIYLRLKPYLIIEISFYIVTEHCCQICILSMMFCRSDCRLWACVGKWLRNQENPRSITSLTSPRLANVGYEIILYM